MTQKQEYINIIENLYPVDSYLSCSEIGEKLLMESIKECNWRDLPEDVLRIYSEKCSEKCEEQEKSYLKKE